jgi:hypothetical protein
MLELIVESIVEKLLTKLRCKNSLTESQYNSLPNLLLKTYGIKSSTTTATRPWMSALL